ncbi:MAG: RNA-binding protein [candidate division Zixibacteria bacterium]|nr:RNA-binding protein [candidate division Zixibacteria bacterium]
MAVKLYVGGLSPQVTTEELQALFAQVGTVESVNIINDKFSGRSRGFGFVEMSSKAEADEAIQKLSGQVLAGSPIVVNEARPQASRGGGGGGGFGGGGYGGGGGRRDRGPRRPGGGGGRRGRY